MKTLLAILLSFIITEAPVLAIHGGYTLGGSESTIGTYAGILVPTSSTALVTGSNAVDYGTNALGIFTLGIADVGAGSGALEIFAGPNEAVGTIVALPDPKNVGGILGIITAAAYESILAISSSSAQVSEALEQLTAEANGSLKASISQASISNSPTGINLEGTSVVTFSTASPTTDFTFGGNLTPTEIVTFAVEGYQQSSEAGTPATL
jgi:hypothetical protein